VNDAAEEAAGLMVLRLWTEHGDRIRVRVTSSSQLDGSDAVTSYAATPAEVLALVQEWLDSLVTPR
jgi:hypothetical protein